MDEAIGVSMSRLGMPESRLESMQPRAPLGLPPSESFASMLDSSFRARARQLGLELPKSPHVSPQASPVGDDVEVIWQRARLQSAALNGPADAVMQAFDEAADARWQARHERGSRGLFDM